MVQRPGTGVGDAASWSQSAWCGLPAPVYVVRRPASLWSCSLLSIHVWGTVSVELHSPWHRHSEHSLATTLATPLVSKFLPVCSPECLGSETS